MNKRIIAVIGTLILVLQISAQRINITQVPSFPGAEGHGRYMGAEGPVPFAPQNSIIPVGDKGHIAIRPLTTDELPPETLEAFLAVGFTNHYEILAQKKDVEQRRKRVWHLCAHEPIIWFAT